MLHLPRDAATVPLVRRLLDQALRTLGVADGCRDDVGLILTEACANVIEHALEIDDYEIVIEVSGERCVLHVVNAGSLVDASLLAPVSPAPAGPAADAEMPGEPVLDEHGRGLHIIRSLADELYLTPSLTGGLLLQAVISLRWTADAEVWQRH
ncbi:ATP-binding protein [Dactylosporangium salmoneum]|uniref:ATP-binding protein n=1 Tax=Dactylosporangium salmoneum TaxID=53361 RepID=UPI0031D44CBD